jgi:hypothetical protein
MEEEWRYWSQCKVAYRKMNYHNKMASERYNTMLKHGKLAKDAAAESNVADEISNTAKAMVYAGGDIYHTMMYRRYSTEVDRLCPLWLSHPDWKHRESIRV